MGLLCELAALRTSTSSNKRNLNKKKQAEDTEKLHQGLTSMVEIRNSQMCGDVFLFCVPVIANHHEEIALSLKTRSWYWESKSRRRQLQVLHSRN